MAATSDAMATQGATPIFGECPRVSCGSPNTSANYRVIARSAVAVWAVAGPLAGIRLQAHVGAHAPAEQIGLAAVLTVSLAGLAAWALLAVLEHRARHPRRAWTITAGSVLAVSLAGPLTAGQGAAAIVALACMHLATGGVLIPVLRRTARQ